MKTQKNRIKYQSQLQRRKAKWGYVFLIPWLLVFAVFYAYPLAYGIIISFTDSKLGSTSNGLQGATSGIKKQVV